MKHRYWSCYKCGRTERRNKKEESHTCSHCNYEMFKTRTTTKADKIRRREWDKRDKARTKYQKFSERYYSKLRNVGGEILVISNDTKRLWKNVMKAKLKPALIRRGQLWLDSLKKDVWNTKKDESRAKQIDYKTGDISESRGGFVGAPILKLVTEHECNYGRFKGGLMLGGMFIELNNKHNTFDLKETLLHEALHWIDSLSQTPCGNHGTYFNKRLDILKSKFRFDLR